MPSTTTLSRRSDRDDARRLLIACPEHNAAAYSLRYAESCPGGPVVASSAEGVRSLSHRRFAAILLDADAGERRLAPGVVQAVFDRPESPGRLVIVRASFAAIEAGLGDLNLLAAATPYLSDPDAQAVLTKLLADAAGDDESSSEPSAESSAAPAAADAPPQYGRLQRVY